MFSPLPLYKDHRRQKLQLKLIEVRILFTDLCLNLLSFHIQPFIFKLPINELFLMRFLGLEIGLIIPNFLHVDRCGVLVPEIAVFEVIDDFDLGGVVGTM